MTFVPFSRLSLRGLRPSRTGFILSRRLTSPPCTTHPLNSGWPESRCVRPCFFLFLKLCEVTKYRHSDHLPLVPLFSIGLNFWFLLGPFVSEEMSLSFSTVDSIFCLAIVKTVSFHHQVEISCLFWGLRLIPSLGFGATSLSNLEGTFGVLQSPVKLYWFRRYFSQIKLT